MTGDRVFVDDVRFYGKHGVTKAEQARESEPDTVSEQRARAAHVQEQRAVVQLTAEAIA